MAATVNEIFLEDLWAREGSNTNWKYSIPYLDRGWTFLKLRISCYLCLYMSSTRKRDHEEKTFVLIARTMIEIKIGATTGNENCVRHVAIFVQEKENFFYSGFATHLYNNCNPLPRH